MYNILILLLISASCYGQTTIRANQVRNTPAGTISATDQQAVNNELDTEKATTVSVALKAPLPVSEAFTSTITFDQRSKYSATTQTGAINFTLAGSGNLDNSTYTATVIGDGVSTLTISSAFNVSGVLDNTKKNYINFRYVSSSLKPVVNIYTEPLMTFINDYSLSISTATPNNSATISDAGAVLDFSNGSGTDEAASGQAWIKLNALSVTHIIAARSTGSALLWQFAVDNSNRLVATFITDVSNYTIKTQTTASLVANIWTHVAWTKSATEAGTAIILYVNGLAVTGTVSNAGTYTGVGSGGTFHIGWQDAGSTTTGNLLIDQVAFWSKVLTPTEIVEEYNGGIPISPMVLSSSANVVSYHSFEQNATDLSGNGHTGTITTAVYSTNHP